MDFDLGDQAAALRSRLRELIATHIRSDTQVRDEVLLDRVLGRLAAIPVPPTKGEQ